MQNTHKTNRGWVGLLGVAWAALPCLAAETLPTMPVNTGFEEGTAGWRIPGALWRIEEGEGRNGSKCLVWENGDPKRYLFPRHQLALEAGGIYRFGAWVKVDSRADGGKRQSQPKVSLDYSNAEGKWIGETCRQTGRRGMGAI